MLVPSTFLSLGCLPRFVLAAQMSANKQTFLLKCWPKCLEHLERALSAHLQKGLFLCFYFWQLLTVIDPMLHAFHIIGVDCEYPPSHGQWSWLGAAFPLVSLFCTLQKYSPSYEKNHSTVLVEFSLQIYPWTICEVLVPHRNMVLLIVCTFPVSVAV